MLMHVNQDGHLNRQMPQSSSSLQIALTAMMPAAMRPVCRSQASVLSAGPPPPLLLLCMRQAS